MDLRRQSGPKLCWLCNVSFNFPLTTLQDLAAMEEERIKSLMSGMAEAGEGAISSDAVGSMIGAQSAAIAQLVSGHPKLEDISLYKTLSRFH